MRKYILSTLFAFVVAGALVSCSKDSGLTNATLPMKTSGGATAANPAITWVSGTVISKKTYQTVAVMDTDATHQANIYTASTTSEVDNCPTWSPSGGSIAWALFPETSSYASSIKTADVSVNSSGVAVGSNVQAIYSTKTADSMDIAFPAWCSVSITGKIAFIREHVGAQLGLQELCTISSSGGAVTVLASYQKLETKNGQSVVQIHLLAPTWSNDDSKIAVVRSDTNGIPTHSTIMIFDASTGAALDSIPIASNLGALEWSRTGTSKLVFTEQATGYIYYCDPTTGSTPTTNSIKGLSETWSPNNSSVMYANSSLMKVIPQTSTTTTVNSTAPGNKMNWKK